MGDAHARMPRLHPDYDQCVLPGDRSAGRVFIVKLTLSKSANAVAGGPTKKRSQRPPQYKANRSDAPAAESVGYRPHPPFPRLSVRIRVRQRTHAWWPGIRAGGNREGWID